MSSLIDLYKTFYIEIFSNEKNEWRLRNIVNNRKQLSMTLHCVEEQSTHGIGFFSCH